MQKAIILRLSTSRIDSRTVNECVSELNGWLADGWHFVSATPLNSGSDGVTSVAGVIFLALVIIEAGEGVE